MDYSTEEDLVQEAMVCVLPVVDRAMMMEEPVGYLYRVARTTMIEVIRNDGLLSGDYRTRQHESVLSLDAPMGGDGDVTLADLVAAPPTGGGSEQQQRWELLSGCIGKMSARKQQALAYRFGVAAPAMIVPPFRIVCPIGRRLIGRIRRWPACARTSGSSRPIVRNQSCIVCQWWQNSRDLYPPRKRTAKKRRALISSSCTEDEQEPWNSKIYKMVENQKRGDYHLPMSP
jgi:hypothetical protein